MCKFIISFFLSAARWYETVWMTCSLYLLVDLRPLHVLWVASPPGTWAGSGSLSRCCTEKFGSLSLLYNQCPESQQFDILGKRLVYNRQYFSTSTEQVFKKVPNGNSAENVVITMDSQRKGGKTQTQQTDERSSFKMHPWVKAMFWD